MDLIQTLAAELGKDPRHVENVVHLLDEGNTIPFIARYRKELHGSMDDQLLRQLAERLQYLRNRGLEERREAVKKSIDEQGKLTDELTAAIDSAKTLAEVEDLYRPYKQKRRTRATMAKEKGLEPLAALLFAQERDCPRPEEAATLSTPKRASRRSRTPCRARATSSLSRSLTTPPSARAFARSFPVRASL